MAINQLSLLKVRRFLPLFLTQFLGAFNDNVYKNALVILITYQFSTQAHLNPEILITVAAGIFILPFFLFSATAGQLADKFEKSQLIRITKIAEIGLMLLVGVSFSLHSIFLLMLILFLLGAQATFFGPMKYSILPDHLHTNELIAGNALLEAGTYLAILLGTVVGGIFAMFHAGPALVSVLVLLIAIAGFCTSLWIPKAAAAAPELKINFNFIEETWKIVNYTFKNRDLALAILGISWFWLVGATYLSQFPTYAKNVLGAESSVVTLFLMVFTVGIGVGSLLCNRLLKGKIHATYVPVAALGMTIFGIDLVIASHHGISHAATLMTLGQFLAHASSWRILFDLLALAICGGVYIVPLYAILQFESEPSHRSRAVASNNIMNAIFMVMAAILTSIMLMLHFSVTHVFLFMAAANLLAAIYICNLLPAELVKSFLIWLFKALYRVEVRGMENYEKAGNRVLIVANHTSLLDAALLAAFLPDKLTFAIYTQYANKWWMKFFLNLVNTYPVDPANPLATKSLIAYLKTNKHVVIFPEGRITVTGALMKIYEGPGLVADKANAPLLPIRINGAQYTPFSYLKGKVKIRWFPKITLTILEPRTFDLPATLGGRERRQVISDRLYDIMTDTMYMSSNIHETMFQSLINAKSVHGRNHQILEDIERKPMTYNRLIMGSIVLGRHIAKSTQPGEMVGTMLPNMIGNVVTFFALQAFHRVPTMLNYTIGSKNILSACRTAKLKRVYTSRRFIDKAGLQDIEKAMISAGIEVIYLENVRKEIGMFSKLYGALVSKFPRLYYRAANGIKEENEKDFSAMPAEVLFTSGSEGEPKGVVLTHENIQANRFQLTARVDFGPSDKVFNTLPMFHSFGLNSATLLPIITGMRVFLYPSPLHYRIVPEMCYDTNATVLFGTDTFLSGYAKYAHAYNFYSIRYIFAGAEKLRDETRRQWFQKFGIRIFEGYGVTEASPVVATNTVMQYRVGSVGRLLPGIDYKLEPVEGIKEGQKLVISGKNVLKGYMFSHTPGEVVPPKEGWHDTGDIVAIDDDGYVTIKGRAKRFAKIAGEMVSLAAVEEEIHLLWPENHHAVLCQPDSKKGEQLVLLTNYKTADQAQILEHYNKRGIGGISLPRKIIILSEVPMLASGKVNYQAAKDIMETDQGKVVNYKEPEEDEES
jgi:acyl-[acyl-carrier-protein]-phospholipid O-acyltransferase/long-chain-fatty-acid--[acyl-carrier-protein] ligase